MPYLYAPDLNLLLAALADLPRLLPCLFLFYCHTSVKFTTHLSPDWCPTTQLNSDTVSLEIVSDPTGLGLSPTRLNANPLQLPTTSPDCHLCFWERAWSFHAFSKCATFLKSVQPGSSVDLVPGFYRGFIT